MLCVLVMIFDYLFVSFVLYRLRVTLFYIHTLTFLINTHFAVCAIMMHVYSYCNGCIILLWILHSLFETTVFDYDN